MPREPRGVGPGPRDESDEERNYRLALESMLLASAVAYREMLLRSRALARTDVRSARHKLVRYERGAVEEVLAALRRVAEKDKRVETAYHRARDRYHRILNAAQVNPAVDSESPDPNDSDRYLYVLRAPKWFLSFPSVVEESREKRRRGRPLAPLKVPYDDDFRYVYGIAQTRLREAVDLSRLRGRVTRSSADQFHSLLEVARRATPLEPEGLSAPWSPMVSIGAPPPKDANRREVESLRDWLHDLRTKRDQTKFELALRGIFVAATDLAIRSARLRPVQARTTRGLVLGLTSTAVRSCFP